MSRLLAVDWGSSSLRAALIEDDGTVVDVRSTDSGMLKVERSGFDAVFEAEFGDWMDVAGMRCLMAGMVGSRQGWVEADYVPCPCGIDDFVARLRAVGPVASRRRMASRTGTTLTLISRARRSMTSRSPGAVLPSSSRWRISS